MPWHMCHLVQDLTRATPSHRIVPLLPSTLQPQLLSYSAPLLWGIGLALTILPLITYFSDNLSEIRHGLKDGSYLDSTVILSP